MKPVLYRYRDSESVIKHMDGYTPGEGWEPLYSQDQVDQLQAQLVRQQKSYEAEIKVEIDSALERAAVACESLGMTTSGIYERNHECASAIRALKESKE
jgi:hypothetical protein